MTRYTYGSREEKRVLLGVLNRVTGRAVTYEQLKNKPILVELSQDEADEADALVSKMRRKFRKERQVWFENFLEDNRLYAEKDAVKV